MKEARREKVDRLILQALLENGRAGVKEIADSVGVSASHVSRRVAAMEESGVIKGYRAVLDLDGLGLGLMALLLVKVRGPDIPRVVRHLSADPSLTAVYEITGAYDIAVVGRFADREEMNEKIKDLLGDPAIEGTNTSIALAVAKEDGAPLLP